MVRPTQERAVLALTEAQSISIGDGVESGEDVDLDGGGTNPDSGGPTPPNAEVVEVVSDSTDALTIDFSESNWWDITLTADCTFAFTNPPPSGTVGLLHIILRQGGVGGWTVAWPAEVQWPDTDGTSGGPSPTLFTAVGARDFVEIITEDGGVSYGGSIGILSASGNDTSLVTVAATGATETVDVSVARTYDLTLDTNCTLTLTGAVNAEAWFLTLLLRQDATGSRLVTWPGSVVWPNAVTPTLATAASSVDVFELFTVDGGTVWFGFPTAGAAAAAALTVKDEGVTLDSNVSSLDFVGAGVTATNVSHAVTVTISSAASHILIADGHATPFAFNDLLQMDDGSDFMWSDP